MLAVVLPAAGGQPAINIQLDAADLENGSKYDFEVRAYYVYIDPKVGRVDNAALVDAIAAPQVFRGTFTSPLTSKALPAPVVFRFDSGPPAPPGMMATIVFKTNIVITPPSGSGRAPIVRERIYGGPSPAAAIPSHCLRIRGPIASGSFYLGVSDCKAPVGAPPKSR